MFKVGDKVVCIYNKFTGIINTNGVLSKYETYTINDISKLNKWNLVGLEDTDLYYEISRFIKLSDFRKQKIDKICSKLEIK